MARIRTYHEDTLFPSESLVLVGEMLYAKIKQKAERKIGKELKTVTAEYLMQKYWRHAEGGACIVMDRDMVNMAIFKKDPELAMKVFDISRGYITVRLRMMLSGEVSRINTFLREVVEEKLIGKRVVVVGGEIEIRFQLIDGDEPKIDPRRNADRYGRKVYCCAREVWRYEFDQRMRSGE